MNVFQYIDPLLSFMMFVNIIICGEVEDVVGALTPVDSGVVQVFHVLLVELRLLLGDEVEEGDREEES